MNLSNKSYGYDELYRSVESRETPEFPSHCPICGAATAHAPGVYECGGAYEPKSQIQTHTNKWWGCCGKYEHIEIVLRFAVMFSMFYNHDNKYTNFFLWDKISMPRDYFNELNVWAEKNYDKYLPLFIAVRKSNNDPRLVCGFTEDLQPQFVPASKKDEIIKRLTQIHFNQYGSFQFHK